MVEAKFTLKCSTHPIIDSVFIALGEHDGLVCSACTCARSLFVFGEKEVLEVPAPRPTSRNHVCITGTGHQSNNLAVGLFSQWPLEVMQQKIPSARKYFFPINHNKARAQPLKRLIGKPDLNHHLSQLLLLSSLQLCFF